MTQIISLAFKATKQIANITYTVIKKKKQKEKSKGESK